MLKFFKRKKDKKSADPQKIEPTPTDEEVTSASDELSPKIKPDTTPDDIPQDEAPQELTDETPTTTAEKEPDIAAPQEEKPKSFFSRLTSSLSKTRNKLTYGLANLFLGKKALDDDLIEEIENHLLMADVGINATENIIETITQGISRKELKDSEAVFQALKDSLYDILAPCEAHLEIKADNKPTIILMVGVNGAGKTTTIGKLAKQLSIQGHSVMLAAGDTFRAAAIEQLTVWGDRNKIPVISQHIGADSASVIYDAVQSAQAKGLDVVLADTAGRLHTRDNLMEELKKVVRVMKKLDDNAPHEVMLVLDAGIGQNALLQAIKFHEAVGVTGLAITKLDGTAKGGIIFAIANELKLPIRYIGVGEKIDDLRPFDAKEFVDALFTPNDERE